MKFLRTIFTLFIISCVVADVVLGACPGCGRKCNSNADCQKFTDGCNLCVPYMGGGGQGICQTGGTFSGSGCPRKGDFCFGTTYTCSDATDGATVCDPNVSTYIVGVSAGSACNYSPCISGSC